FLAADSVSVPVSCNSALEQCGWFQEVRRTRIGSPYVVASMIEAGNAGAKRVVGYEANGGFLLYSVLAPASKTPPALPTRDAAIVILGVLLLAKREKKTLSQLVSSLPRRFTSSDRLQDFPTANSAAILARFSSPQESHNRQALEALVGADLGPVQKI